MKNIMEIKPKNNQEKERVFTDAKAAIEDSYLNIIGLNLHYVKKNFDSVKDAILKSNFKTLEEIILEKRNENRITQDVLNEINDHYKLEIEEYNHFIEKLKDPGLNAEIFEKIIEDTKNTLKTLNQ